MLILILPIYTLFVNNFSNNRLNAEAAKKIAPGIAKNKGLETLLVSSKETDFQPTDWFSL